MEIRQLPTNEYGKALDLSLDIFIERGRKDFDEGGLETFKNFIYNKQLVNELTFYRASDGKFLIGVTATGNEGRHISLSFIKPSYHRRGVGKQLFKTAILNQPIPGVMVNSSSYAISIHRKFGFEPACEEQVTHGMKYTPMKRMGIKVRELERAC